MRLAVRQRVAKRGDIQRTMTNAKIVLLRLLTQVFQQQIRAYISTRRLLSEKKSRVPPTPTKATHNAVIGNLSQRARNAHFGHPVRTHGLKC